MLRLCGRFTAPRARLSLASLANAFSDITQAADGVTPGRSSSPTSAPHSTVTEATIPVLKTPAAGEGSRGDPHPNGTPITQRGSVLATAFAYDEVVAARVRANLLLGSDDAVDSVCHTLDHSCRQLRHSEMITVLGEVLRWREQQQRLMQDSPRSSMAPSECGGSSDRLLLQMLACTVKLPLLVTPSLAHGKAGNDRSSSGCQGEARGLIASNGFASRPLPRDGRSAVSISSVWWLQTLTRWLACRADQLTASQCVQVVQLLSQQPYLASSSVLYTCADTVHRALAQDDAAKPAAADAAFESYNFFSNVFDAMQRYEAFMRNARVSSSLPATTTMPHHPLCCQAVYDAALEGLSQPGVCVLQRCSPPSVVFLLRSLDRLPFFSKRTERFLCEVLLPQLPHHLRLPIHSSHHLLLLTLLGGRKPFVVMNSPVWRRLLELLRESIPDPTRGKDTDGDDGRLTSHSSPAPRCSSAAVWPSRGALVALLRSLTNLHHHCLKANSNIGTSAEAERDKDIVALRLALHSIVAEVKRHPSHYLGVALGSETLPTPSPLQHWQTTRVASTSSSAFMLASPLHFHSNRCPSERMTRLVELLIAFQLLPSPKTATMPALSSSPSTNADSCDTKSLHDHWCRLFRQFKCGASASSQSRTLRSRLCHLHDRLSSFLLVLMPLVISSGAFPHDSRHEESGRCGAKLAHRSAEEGAADAVAELLYMWCELTSMVGQHSPHAPSPLAAYLLQQQIIIVQPSD